MDYKAIFHLLHFGLQLIIVCAFAYIRRDGGEKEGKREGGREKGETVNVKQKVESTEG